MNTNTSETDADPAFDELNSSEIVAREIEAAKEEEPIKFKSREQQAREWQVKADSAVEAALLDVPENVAGVTLLPFSTARGSLLRRIGNEFVQGVALTDIVDPFLSVGKFLVIMSNDLKEARRLVASEEALEDAAYALLDALPIADIGTVVGKINTYVHSQMENQVHGSVHLNEGDEAPPSGPKN